MKVGVGDFAGELVGMGVNVAVGWRVLVAKSRGVIGRNVLVGVGSWGVEGLHPEIISMRIKARISFFIIHY